MKIKKAVLFRFLEFQWKNSVFWKLGPRFMHSFGNDFTRRYVPVGGSDMDLQKKQKKQKKKKQKETESNGKQMSFRMMGTGQPEIVDLCVINGSTGADVLRDLKMEDGELQDPNTGETIPNNVDLCKAYPEFSKFLVYPGSHVAGSGLEGISTFKPFSFFKDKISKDGLKKKIESVKPSYKQTLPKVYPRNEIKKVKPIEDLGLDAELALLGWIKEGNGYVGFPVGSEGATKPLLKSTMKKGCRSQKQ